MTLPEYERIASAARDGAAPAVTNIPLVHERAATGEVAALYQHFRAHFGRPDVPGILQCFATHPPLLRHMMDLSEHMIFADGTLTRKQKEMIATFVSAQNACPYCADSHGFFLRIHGGTERALAALQSGDLCSSALSEAERVLLSFASKVNVSSDQINRSDVELLLQAGWSELQAAESVHIVALFAAFNRVANAFGLGSQGLLALYEGGPLAAEKTRGIEKDSE